MSKTKYVYVADRPGPRAFTMPDGFEGTVEIHLWGAGGGAGAGGAPGGGGGYSYSIASIAEGDIVEVGVGLQGSPAQDVNTPGAGGGSGIGLRYSGSPGGGRGSWCGNVDGPMASGGGGGASVVLINGVAVAVAAGGGGGGGYGHRGYKLPGLAGGVYTSLNSTTQGATATWGGGGGGGYFGGASGYATGHNVTGGSGGQNYASGTGALTLPGSGANAGGKGLAFYPVGAYGNAGYPGYAVLVFERAYQIKFKHDDEWKKIKKLWVKVSDQYDHEDHHSHSETVTFNIPGSHIFTVPNQVTQLTYTIVGGGGGGGYSNRNSAVDAKQHSGGGGGSGGYRRMSVPVTPGQVLTCSVGAGGAGAPQNPNASQEKNVISPRLNSEVYATAGGTTSITIGATTYTATGGSPGGNAKWSDGTAGAGGALGTPSGNAGQAGEVVENNETDPRGGGVGYATGGTGGRSPFGSAGAGGAGAGVGQVLNNSTEAAYSGGSGKAGLVSIDYSVTAITRTGGWKEITQAYYKADNQWFPLISSEVINDGRSQKWLIQGTYTWTCPADILRVKASVYGAGGSGTGGAGGSGGYAEKYLTVTPGQSYTVIVGAGGIGSQAGQASSFAGTIVANGGGAGVAPNGGSSAGGAGGTASGGDINLTGRAGTAGRTLYSYYYWWWGWNGYWGWGGYHYYNYNYNYFYGYNYNYPSYGYNITIRSNNYYNNSYYSIGGGGWWGGYWGWGWPGYWRATGYDFGEPGQGYDGIGSGAVGPSSKNPAGSTGAVFLIY